MLDKIKYKETSTKYAILFVGNTTKGVIMKELEKMVQEETFEIEVQYCDPDDCLHDCIHSGVNNCDAIITGWR